MKKLLFVCILLSLFGIAEATHESSWVFWTNNSNQTTWKIKKGHKSRLACLGNIRNNLSKVLATANASKSPDRKIKVKVSLRKGWEKVDATITLLYNGKEVTKFIGWKCLPKGVSGNSI